jgi:hypothetical protein
VTVLSSRHICCEGSIGFKVFRSTSFDCDDDGDNNNNNNNNTISFIIIIAREPNGKYG